MLGQLLGTMPDRADYLARTLLTRRRALERILAEDGVSGAAGDARRQELVLKVLAVEAGVTDGTLVRRVWSAQPDYRAQQDESEQARAEFADFLRGVLRFD